MIPEIDYIYETKYCHNFLCENKHEFAIYQNAISSTYWTMPSVASLFTGMYTSGHGLVTDGDQLDEMLPSLPTILQNEGYRSAAFVRNVYVSEYSGLNKGFDEFYCTFKLDYLKKIAAKFARKSLGRAQPPGINNVDPSFDEIDDNSNRLPNIAAKLIDILSDAGGRRFVRDFKRWLPAEQGRPFFAYFHFLETHSPYRAPLKYAFNFLTLRENIKKLFVNHNHLKFLTDQDAMNADDFDLLIGAYDNAIRYLDALVAQIIHQLKKYRYYDDTMIILLSDHGDNIGDHGLMFHYWCLYDTLIKIPLMIKYPRITAPTGEIDRIAQNVDILPTILGILDKNDRRYTKHLQGNDLLQEGGEYRRPPEIAISELVKPFGPDRRMLRDRFKQYDRRLLSIRTANRKFIYSSRKDHECYDLQADPQELNNLYPQTDRFEELIKYAETYYRRMDEFYQKNKERIEGQIETAGIDSKIKEKLKSLGYM
jgi:arylsulfatase A-like enzyme